MAINLWTILLGVLLLTLPPIILARNSINPLIDDDGTTIRNKAAECIFGKQVKELGSQWIPDLGPPIGVLYCMKCECNALQKKRRIVAKVQCHSIKNECPEPKCPEPVNLPGRCCKTCPGDNHSPDVPDIVPQNTLDEEEKSNRHYIALLTGRSSLVLKNDYSRPISNEINKNNVVATGRFNFHKKNLHYSFYISDKAARPRSLQFVDDEGNILEEFQLSRAGGVVNSLYQNITRKVCGVWRRLPRDYRRKLKQEKMFAVLVWGVKDQAEFTLSGRLTKQMYSATLGAEHFSSLLEPAPGTSSVTMSGAGGTASVSISTTPSPLIHITIMFNGIVSGDDMKNIPVNITLSQEGKKLILDERVKVLNPQNDVNIVELSSVVELKHLRLLAGGRVLLSISSVSKPDLRLSGNVITKATCELYQAVLSSPQSSDHNANPFGTSGIAWFYVNNEGYLVYDIQIDDLKQEPFIYLVDVKKKQDLEELIPQFSNGTAHGTVDKLNPKILEPLYAGNLALNVATYQRNSTLIRGRLVVKPVADARDAPFPFLLKRENQSLSPSAVGLAWISVDNDCHIHYDVTVNGLGNDRKLELHLELLEMLAPGSPFSARHLDDFQGNQLEGSPVNSLSEEEIRRLEIGNGFLKIKERNSKQTLLSARLEHVSIPQHCNPPSSDNVIHTLFDHDIKQTSGDCFSQEERKFYKEDTQWTSATDACTMCFCQNGKNKCHTMSCPEVQCSVQLETPPGECCPICPTNITEKCIFNGKSYSAGSKFHPFLIPTGFDNCTECICDPQDLEIKCTRHSNEKVCCENCQKTNDNSMNGTYHADDEVQIMLAEIAPRKEIPMKSAEEILAEGGCINLNNPRKPYTNGSEYHPVTSLGLFKCVTCKCQNGNQTCTRQHCDQNTCEKMLRLRRKKNFAAVSLPEYRCCSLKDCRRYRHRNNHRPLNRLTS